MADSYTELEKAVVVLVENFYKYVSKHSLAKDKIDLFAQGPRSLVSTCTPLSVSPRSSS